MGGPSPARSGSGNQSKLLTQSQPFRKLIFTRSPCFGPSGVGLRAPTQHLRAVRYGANHRGLYRGRQHGRARGRRRSGSRAAPARNRPGSQDQAACPQRCYWHAAAAVVRTVCMTRAHCRQGQRPRPGSLLAQPEAPRGGQEPRYSRGRSPPNSQFPRRRVFRTVRQGVCALPICIAVTCVETDCHGPGDGRTYSDRRRGREGAMPRCSRGRKPPPNPVSRPSFYRVPGYALYPSAQVPWGATAAR